MPPKVENARAMRRKVAAADAAPVASPAKKRGRPAKVPVDDTIQGTAVIPKKRGRPAKATTEDVSESAKRGRGRGRPSDATALAVPDATPKKGKGESGKDTKPTEQPSTARRGRPRKEVVAETAPTPRGRGRPRKAPGLDLNRVAGSARVNKQSSDRSKTTTSAATAARLNPHMRSKLRTRLPPTKKLTQEEPVPQLARRGRPPKNAAQAPSAKKATSRKAAETPASKPSKPAKAAAPRKMRGHTVRQIPDKYVGQVDQLLHDLMQAESNLPSAEHNQEQGQGHATESEADVDKDENMEPTSAVTGDGAQEEASEDAGTGLMHQQDGAGDQYSISVAGDLAQSESALGESKEPEQDMQFGSSGGSNAPLNSDNEDGVVVPAGDIDMPNVGYEKSAEDGQGLTAMENQEGHVHESPMPSSTVVIA